MIVDYIPWIDNLFAGTLRVMAQGFEDLLQTIAANTREIRESRGLSQETLALEADVDRTYVSQIERGVANPSLRVLFQIAAVLNVAMAELLESKPRKLR